MTHPDPSTLYCLAVIAALVFVAAWTVLLEWRKPPQRNRRR